MSISNNLKPWQKGNSGRPEDLPHLRGNAHPCAKLTEDKVRWLKSPLGYIPRKKGHTMKDCAKILGVSPSCLGHVIWGTGKKDSKCKKNWSHVS